MKKAVAIFFLSVYMLSFSELHQFLKIPILVQHFIEHRQQDPTISLLSFLYEHYIHQLRDADYQRDRQLPFRNTDCNVVYVSICCECPVNTVVELQVHTTETKHEFILHDEDNNSLLSVADIFQPPRCA